MVRLGLFVVAMLLATPASAQPSRLSAEQEREVRASVKVATEAVDFNEDLMRLDVYRALRGAGVALSTTETIAMARDAFMRGYPGEAETVALALFPDGVPRDAEAAGFEGMAKEIRRAAAEDREGGLERGIADAEHPRQARHVYSADYWITMAVAFAGADDHVRAVEYYQRGLIVHDPDKLQLEAMARKASQDPRRSIEFYRLSLGPDRRALTPSGLALAQLNLGISQFRLDRVEEARTTWAAIEGSSAVEALAQVWIGVADRAAE